MCARGLPSPDRADAVIGAGVLSAPGYSGAIRARDLAGIAFGRPGPRLFSSEQITFADETPPEREGVLDIGRVARYPFNMK